jgi:predicted nucleic acid-binding protein
VKYCIDTNTLIHAWQFWYAPDTHPTFWTGIEELARKNRLKMPEQVLLERSEKEDDLSLWCRERSNVLVYSATEETEKTYRDLVNQYPDMTGRLGMGDDFADLYVVAVASVNEASVVTNEDMAFERTPTARQRKIKNYKVTNVCHELNIPMTRLYNILREEGWVFTHR